MIVNAYKVPSWILGADNKPSYELFNFFIQGEGNDILVKTIEEPNLYTIKIQLSTDSFKNYNLFELNNRFYQVVDYTTLNDLNNKQVYEVVCNIDIYLSFIVSYFNQANAININNSMDSLKNSPFVLFEQKHLNRYTYINDGNPSERKIAYSKQFYLLNKHDIDITNYIKNVQPVSYYNYYDFSSMDITKIPNNFLETYDRFKPLYYYQNNSGSSIESNNLFSYLVANISPNENNLPYYLNTHANPYGFVLFTNTYYTSYKSSGVNMFVSEFKQDISDPSFTTWGSLKFQGSTYNVTQFSVWWATVYLNFGKGQYVDIVNFPILLNMGFGVSTSLNLNQDIFNSSILVNVPIVSLQDIWGSQGTSYPQNVPVFLPWLNNIYFLKVKNALPYSQNNLDHVFEEYVIEEPAYFNFCNYRVRASGQDTFMNLTGFDYTLIKNLSLSSFFESFSIAVNHPLTQITNIPYSIWLIIKKQFESIKNSKIDLDFVSAIEPWEYNYINDSMYCINWRNGLASFSNNWNTFLNSNLDSYHTAMNVTHYAIQKDQAAIAFSTMEEAANIAAAPFQIIGGMMDGHLGNAMANVSSNILGTANSIAQNSLSLKQQQAEYNYLKYGKQKDMSRIANEKTAVGDNSFSLGSGTLTYILELPTPQETQYIFNYYKFNGYKLNRWIPFSLWNNRRYFNYVKCSFFTDNIMEDYFGKYKELIDSILNKGIRVWNLTDDISLFNNLKTLPFGLFETNSSNTEININNNELKFINNEVNNY